MINNILLPKAYREVIEIIKYLPQKDYEKIPSSIIENMQREMDKDYIYDIIDYDDLEKQNMLHETEIILAVFYRDYWATEYQRKVILENEKEYMNKKEEEKRKKYNPNKIFNNNKNNFNNSEMKIRNNR